MVVYAHAGYYEPKSWPNQRGTPTPGATIGFYADDGSDTLIDLWADRDRSAPFANPFTLDPNGNNPPLFGEPDVVSHARRVVDGVPEVRFVEVEFRVDDEDAVLEPSGAEADYLGTVASEPAMLALGPAGVGDWAIRSDTASKWIIVAGDGTVIGDWVEDPQAVTSVNGQQGVVVLTAADVGADLAGAADDVAAAAVMDGDAAGGVLGGTFPDPTFATPQVAASLYDANTVLVAQVDNTPVALTVAPSTVVGRAAAGGIVALTGAQVLTIATGGPVGGAVDVLAGLVTQGLRDASNNPPLNLGTGALSAGSLTIAGTTVTFTGASGNVVHATQALTLAGTQVITTIGATEAFRANASAMLMPGAHDARDLGSMALRWRTLFAASVIADNGTGVFNSGTGRLVTGSNNGAGLIAGQASGGGANVWSILDAATLQINAASATIQLRPSNTTTLTVSTTALTVPDAVNLVVGSTTGTKIGTATTQLLGFYNATPVAQVAGTVDVLAGLVTLGLRAASSNPPLNLGTGALSAGVTVLTGTTGTILDVISTNSRFRLSNYDSAFNVLDQVVFNGGTRINANSVVAEGAAVDLLLGGRPLTGAALTQLRLDKFGNVGIGAPALPLGLLHVAQPSTGRGSVATTATTALVGTSTQFTNTFRVGDRITVAGETVRTIATITDDTHLTVTVAFSNTASGLGYVVTDAGTVLKVEGNGRVTILPNNGATNGGGFFDPSTRFGSSTGPTIDANGTLVLGGNAANPAFLFQVAQGGTSLVTFGRVDSDATAGNLISSKVMTNLARTSTVIRGYTGLTGSILDVQDVGGTSVLRLAPAAVGFFNATAAAQPAGSSDVLGSLVTLGLRAASSNPPLNLGTGALTAGSVQSPSGTSLAITTAGASDFILLSTTSTLRVTIGQNITIADAVNIAVNTGTGTKIATATGQKLAFHNSNPVIQRASANQAAADATAATNTLPFGYATQAQADGIVTLLNELRAALVEKGLIKGSA